MAPSVKPNGAEGLVATNMDAAGRPVFAHEAPGDNLSPQALQDKADTLRVWPNAKVFRRVGAVSGQGWHRISVDGEEPLGVAETEAEVWAKFGEMARAHLRDGTVKLVEGAES